MAYAQSFGAGYGGKPPRRARLTAIAAALGANAALIAGLWLGLPVTLTEVVSRPLAVFDVVPPPPPPEIEKPAAKPSTANEGAAAPPNRKARPVPVVAPEPKVVTRPPMPLPVAPAAADGTESASGAAETPGPGTGAGGVGSGTGNGGSGTGSGSGIAVHARHTSGTITNRDYPKSASKAGVRGSVTVTLSVDARGRVTNCTVALSSGNAALDATTCRLAQKRFRYDPARNGNGEAVPDLAGWRQDWWLEGQRRP
ncbi:energy transducer TonB [Stakelama marina]|uniref:Protein TonB n=1 Tax=Stakelama marina TaxID=2826939 RepID=A0A8T4IFZ3_9SPHN|nr:TonB family protein [Stakelama marina]MBR0553381.1 TonB family protein [Stakelama marina]